MNQQTKTGQRKLSTTRIKRKKTREDRTEPPGLVCHHWADLRAHAGAEEEEESRWAHLPHRRRAFLPAEGLQ